MSVIHTRKQALLRDAGKLWVPARPAIIRPRERNLLPGFCIPHVVAAAAGTTPNPNPFGTLLFTGENGANSVTNPSVISFFINAAETAETVYVGDLIIVVFGEEVNLTATAVTDNLGNTYTASNLGTDAINVAGRMFYSRVTVAGVITAINIAATASGNNWQANMAAFAGPFSTASLVDVNLSNNTDDTSPHNCPATGVRAQNIELVIGWATGSGNTGDFCFNAMTTGTLAVNASGPGGTPQTSIGYTVTVSTSPSITHVFTSTDTPGDAVLGTTSFRNGS